MAKEDFIYPEINMIKTGRLLREISKRKSFSVKKIQAALGLASNQAVYDWFNGKSLPTLNNLFALSCLFKLPMESMIISDVERNNYIEKLNMSKTEKNCLIRILVYQRRLKICA